MMGEKIGCLVRLTLDVLTHEDRGVVLAASDADAFRQACQIAAEKNMTPKSVSVWYLPERPDGHMPLGDFASADAAIVAAQTWNCHPPIRPRSSLAPIVYITARYLYDAVERSA